VHHPIAASFISGSDAKKVGIFPKKYPRDHIDKLKHNNKNSLVSAELVLDLKVCTPINTYIMKVNNDNAATRSISNPPQ
jgi:hypothetical protein